GDSATANERAQALRSARQTQRRISTNRTKPAKTLTSFGLMSALSHEVWWSAIPLTTRGRSTPKSAAIARPSVADPCIVRLSPIPGSAAESARDRLCRVAGGDAGKFLEAGTNRPQVGRRLRA